MQLNPLKFPIPNSEIPNPKSIKNLIFDFGNVICDLDFQRTEKQMTSLGFNVDDAAALSKLQELIALLETGKISPQEFRDELRSFISRSVTDVQLDDAWNALLLDIPEPRIRLLEKLRKQFRIFLLSNSNEIHYLKYLDNFRRQYGYPDFDALFDKAYFSYRIGFSKPSREIFSYVLRDAGLNPAETLFIDDTLMHVEGARLLGIHSCHLQTDRGEQILDLFLPE